MIAMYKVKGTRKSMTTATTCNAKRNEDEDLSFYRRRMLKQTRSVAFSHSL